MHWDIEKNHTSTCVANKVVRNTNKMQRGTSKTIYLLILSTISWIWRASMSMRPTPVLMRVQHGQKSIHAKFYDLRGKCHWVIQQQERQLTYLLKTRSYQPPQTNHKLDPGSSCTWDHALRLHTCGWSCPPILCWPSTNSWHCNQRWYRWSPPTRWRILCGHLIHSEFGR